MFFYNNFHGFGKENPVLIHHIYNGIFPCLHRNKFPVHGYFRPRPVENLTAYSQRFRARRCNCYGQRNRLTDLPAIRSVINFDDARVVLPSQRQRRRGFLYHVNRTDDGTTFPI